MWLSFIYGLAHGAAAGLKRGIALGLVDSLTCHASPCIQHEDRCPLLSFSHSPPLELTGKV